MRRAAIVVVVAALAVLSAAPALAGADGTAAGKGWNGASR